MTGSRHTFLFSTQAVIAAIAVLTGVFTGCAPMDGDADVQDVRRIDARAGTDGSATDSPMGETSPQCVGANCDAGVMENDVPSAMEMDVPTTGMDVPPGADVPNPVRTDSGRPGADASADSGLPMVPIVRNPPALPRYSRGACPMLRGGTTAAASLNTNFASGMQTRQFRVVTPRVVRPGVPLPVVIAYHWINGSSAAWLTDGELVTAAEQLQFIAVLPDSLKNAGGAPVYPFQWPFNDAGGIPGEIQFFNDMLACVADRFPVDPRKVYGLGVSAGGLWMTYLSTTTAVNHLAAVEVISGGLGEFGGWRMNYMAQSNKFPTLVLWGGVTDMLMGFNFDLASRRYRDALRADNHFVVQCIHNMGHGLPPLPPAPPGMTRYHALYQFFLDHPYGMAPNDSPYARLGRVPADFPAFCSIAR